MTSRLKFLVPAAACVALSAVAFANVARAEDAPAKPDAMSADHMSGDHMAPMKKHHMKKHMMKEGDHMMAQRLRSNPRFPRARPPSLNKAQAASTIPAEPSPRSRTDRERAVDCCGDRRPGA